MRKVTLFVTYMKKNISYTICPEHIEAIYSKPEYKLHIFEGVSLKCVYCLYVSLASGKDILVGRFTDQEECLNVQSEWRSQLKVLSEMADDLDMDYNELRYGVLDIIDKDKLH